ncbi:hypothetical protein LCGC14_1207700 [marine sediment metagenome]|uniref:NTP pyrophosphohydrolase MazG-like domain-containing protein n=1 Tax=marine sediment metagenome TaxID=412755 RepID=A0A0F9LJF5_9ZZZZ
MEEVIREVIEKEFEGYHEITQRHGQVIGLNTLKQLMEDHGLYKKISEEISSRGFKEDIIDTEEGRIMHHQDEPINKYLGRLREEIKIAEAGILSKTPAEDLPPIITKEEVLKDFETQKETQAAENLPGHANAMEVELLPTFQPITFAEKMNWTDDPISYSLSRIQTEIGYWATHNFPTETSLTNLLGVVEEVGELAHAELKGTMGIRGVDDEEAKDAVGDILIFLASYCNQKGFDMRVVMNDVWRKVKQRDWQLYPIDGISK